MNIVEIDSLFKKYGDNVAVNNLSLTIDEKGVYGFLGPNGAGKSTTMNILTGYIGATSGTVKIDGYDILKEPEKAKKNIGYLPEMPPVYQDMTVAEYLDFVSKIKKISKKDRESSVNEAIELTKIEQVKDRLIRNLSKGYKQRVGIAQAIMGMPKLIVLDEPTVGLDPKQIIEIRDLIRYLGKEHTVILSSHILTEISEVCEKIFIISQGKLVANGSEQQMIDELAGNNVIEIKVNGSSEQMKEIVSKFDAKISSIDMNEQICDAIITTSIETDIREKLFYELAANKMPILELKFKTKSLEDIFIELTSEYKAPDKKKNRKLRRSSNNEKVLDETETMDNKDTNVENELQEVEK